MQEKNDKLQPQTNTVLSEDMQPEATQPEDTQHTQPEDTQPEDTQPEDTQPEDTQSEAIQPEDMQLEAIQLEVTQPEVIVVEATQPDTMPSQHTSLSEKKCHEKCYTAILSKLKQWIYEPEQKDQKSIDFFPLFRAKALPDYKVPQYIVFMMKI